MLTSKPTDNDRAKVPARSGHGAASIIPRLNEQISRPEPQLPEAGSDEPLASEVPRPQAPGPLAPKEILP
jgi:hypothetical protein